MREGYDTKAPDYQRLREVWRGVRKRCYNTNCKDYPHYGGRGITMCDEWRDDFYAFHDWAVSHGYDGNKTLDRVNNRKGYYPANCRWVSRRAQANNRTTARYYEVDGHLKTLIQWSREYGVAPSTILHRIDDGWSVEDAVKTPSKNNKKV